MEIVDLTVELSEITPVYPGDSKVKISQDTTVANDGFMQHSLSLITHVGTHIDAPAHMISGGKN